MFTLFIIFLIVLTVLFALSYVLPVNVSSGIHGTAHFGSDKLLSKTNNGFVIDGVRRLTPKDSFIHSATIASTGMGKTTRIVIPNVLQLEDCSMIISDPKGEIENLTKHDLKRRGFKVMTLDFSDMGNSIRYNPLHRANTEGEIKQIAASFYDMANAGAKSEGIWRLGAVRLLEILILLLKNQPHAKDANMKSLLKLLNCCEDGTDTLYKFVMKYAPINAQNLFKAFTNSEVKIKLGQLASAQACLAPYDTKEIRDLTAKDTLNFEQFRKEKTVLFLKLPVGVSNRYTSVLNLFYTQLFRYLLNTDIESSDLPIYCIMDEFANLRKIPDFTRTLTLIRSKRVSINIIFQAISQLDSTYGKDETETILSNCASLIAFAGIREKRTLEYISMMLGTTTKEVHTPGAFGLTFFSRPLMTIDELRTLPASRGLFLFSNRAAQKIRPIPIFRNTELMEKAKLKSENGELEVDTPTLDLPVLEDEPVFAEADISDDMENPEIRRMKERLKEILPD